VRNKPHSENAGAPKAACPREGGNVSIPHEAFIAALWTGKESSNPCDFRN